MSRTKRYNFYGNWITVKRGEQHHNAKLTEQEVREMRTKYLKGGYTHRSIAKEYNISASQASKILLGMRWTHI